MSPTIHDIPIKHNTHAIVTEKTLEYVQNQLSMTSDQLDVIRNFHLLVHNVQPKIDY